MIQRKQTLFLLLAAILLLVTPFLPLGTIVSADSSESYSPFSAICNDGNYSAIGYAIVLILAAIIAIIDIFLWKNRPLQMRIATLDLLMVILSYGVFFLYRSTAGDDIRYLLCIANFLPIAAIFSLSLAIQGIRKDEKLIKSLDRIR